MGDHKEIKVPSENNEYKKSVEHNLTEKLTKKDNTKKRKRTRSSEVLIFVAQQFISIK